MKKLSYFFIIAFSTIYILLGANTFAQEFSIVIDGERDDWYNT